MSFNKKKNRDDEWAAFRNELSEIFELFVDSDLSSVNHEDFEEYLDEGNNPHFHTSIIELTDIKFLFLEKLVNAWSGIPLVFEAFYLETTKRFDYYD